MAYNTGNAIGSADARDLYDNAQNLDKAMHSTDPTWIDRFGVARPTFKGAESELNQKVDDAEAAATEARGYLNTMRATSYGPLAEDPTTDPLGHPCTAGDEYFNTTYNLLKRFDGVIWRVPDINTENLASGAGSSMVGHGGQTVEAALNERLPEIGNYALLRAYTGPVTSFFVCGVANIFDGGFGPFRVDAADTTSADNGGTILVDDSGRRWKRDYSRVVNAKWFYLVGDGVADDEDIAIQAAINALPSDGGVVRVPAGRYKIANTLIVGNGSNFSASSKNCIKIQGEGIAPYFGSSGGTEFVWTGAAGGSVLVFAGSGDGFGLDGVEINCAGVAAHGLVCYSTRLSTYSNFAVREFTDSGILLDIRNGPLASVLYASGNVFQNWISTSSIENTKGISIKGDYANNNDWHRNTFICGQTQVKRAAVGESYGAYLEFTDSNTWIECDLNVYGAGNGFGLFLNGANNHAYPQNNFFYGCSIISVGWYETASLIGENLFYGFCTKDSEVAPSHPRLRGITDSGVLFGSFNFSSSLSTVSQTLIGSQVSEVFSTDSGNAQWRILNNANDSVSHGFYISYSTDGVSWTVMFSITPGGEVYVNIPGTGFRAITAGTADSGGPGYRVLLVKN